jgi:hypothetical protein
MRRWRRRSKGGRHSDRARGAAVVEFAVILPLLLTILFGIIEYGWLFMVRQTLQQAAREGCRVGILQSSQPADVQARVDGVMGAGGLSGYTFTYAPAVPGVDPTETVTVTIPYAEVSLLGVYFGRGDGEDMVGTCSMRKEGL